MTEIEFINQLKDALSTVPADQREDILGEYRSHFFEGKNRGKTEQSIAEGFGDPRAIARTYVADYHFEQWQSPTQGQGISSSLYHLARGLVVIFSLLFFNFFFMLWPILAIAITLFVGWALVAVTILLSVIFSIVGLAGGAADFVLATGASQMAVFFYSVGTGILGVLMGFLLYHLSRLTVAGILRYIKINVNLVAA